MIAYVKSFVHASYHMCNILFVTRPVDYIILISI